LDSNFKEIISFYLAKLYQGTILKQLESIHNHKIRKFQVENIITSLHENALDCMRSLFQALDNYGLKVESREAARIMVKFLRSPMCKFIEKVFRMFWNDTNLGVQNVLNFLPQRPLTFKPYIKVDIEIGKKTKSFRFNVGCGIGDPIQQAYKRRAEFWLLDSCEYYMRNLDRFAQEDFEPNEEDVQMFIYVCITFSGAKLVLTLSINSNFWFRF